jgi:hypothetical protein
VVINNPSIITIRNTAFSNQELSHIYYIGYSGSSFACTLDLIDCHFGETAGNNWAVYLMGLARGDIIGCTFENISTNVLYFSYLHSSIVMPLYFTASKGSLKNSTFRNNVLEVVRVEGALEISDNTFEDNACNETCIHVEPNRHYYATTPDWYTGDFLQNQFHRNSGTQLIYIEVFGDNSEFQYNNLTGNSVKDNYVGVTLKWIGNLVVRYNLFDNPDIQFDMQVTDLWGSPPMEVSYNWWGSSDERLVELRQWDFYDDHTRTIANYLPFLLEPSFLGDLSPVDSQLWFVNSNIWLRGNVISDFTLFGNQTYYLNGTVFVPEGITLTIDPGAIFLCELNSGNYLLDECFLQFT